MGGISLGGGAQGRALKQGTNGTRVLDACTSSRQGHARLHCVLRHTMSCPSWIWDVLQYVVVQSHGIAASRHFLAHSCALA